MPKELAKLNVLMCGTGEYTTGWVGTGASKSDKKIGVVGLTMFDLRRLGKVDKLGMVGVNGSKFPAIREHLAANIGSVYKDMDLTLTNSPNKVLSTPRLTRLPSTGCPPAMLSLSSLLILPIIPLPSTRSSGVFTSLSPNQPHNSFRIIMTSSQQPRNITSFVS